MGNDEFITFVNKYLPGVITTQSKTRYAGRKVVFDTSQIMYKSSIRDIKHNNSNHKTSNGKTTSHIHGILKSIFSSFRSEVLPIYVFDGKPPDIKDGVIYKRRKIKKKAIEQFNDELTENEKIKLKCKSLTIRTFQYRETEELLYVAGIPYVQSPGEADAQCAGISIYNDENELAGVGSEDCDMLAHGARAILKSFHNKFNEVVEIRHDVLLEKMREFANSILLTNNKKAIDQFTHSNFIDCFILFNCDNCTKITHISAIDKFKIFILNDMNMVNVIKELQSSRLCVIPSDYQSQWENAKNYYLDAKIINPKKIDMRFAKPNVREVERILREHHDFNSYEINRIIRNLNSYYYKFAETNPNFVKKEQNIVIEAKHNLVPSQQIELTDNNNKIDDTLDGKFSFDYTKQLLNS